MSALEHDTMELISNGMVTLHSKLNGVEDDAVVDRVAAVWSDFWDNILPYTEGVSDSSLHLPHNLSYPLRRANNITHFEIPV